MSEGESDQFSLRWNNFHSNLTSGFHALLQGEDLVDVTLAAGGQFVQAHKIVLSVCSPYFKDLFKVNPCKHPIVILKDVCHKDLVAILQFMYRGEVNVRQEELATFLKTAEMLQIKGLTGEDSPIEEDITPVPQPSVRTRAPRRVSEKSLHGTPEKKETVANPVTAEPEEASAPPYKRMKPEVSSAVLSSPVITEESSGVEFIEMTNPKQEPVEYETEIEEVNRLQNRDDPLVQLLGGESSQTLQDSSQGSSIFASIPSASQDSGLPQDCGQGNLQLIKSSRGRYQLVHNGFIYNTDRQSGRRVFWRCSEYQRIGCRGRIVTVDCQLLVKCSTHNHESQDEKIREKMAMAEIKEQALLAKQLNTQNLLNQQQFGIFPAPPDQ
ncbi:modifier of mdg4 isoform X1 [Cryptotermes secundus]|uniref:modifier of mdg4 isoform X1 n=1 Tax=Cryptotermes secundus TaxID=105785 RepID=UPI000CD7BF8C|nr:modifier of mdg4 isoform X1 [Cryptotermes secundus]